MTSSNPAAGWFPNPENPNEWRQWDGTAWTNITAPKMSDTPPPMPGDAPQVFSAPQPVAPGSPTAVGGMAWSGVESNRLRRYFARVLDGFVMMVPGIILMIIGLGIIIPVVDTTNTGEYDEYGYEIIDVDAPGWIFFLVVGLVLAYVFLAFLYERWAVNKMSATYGKKWLGLIIVDEHTGQPVEGNMTVASKRSLMVLLTTIIPGISGILSWVNMFMVLISPHRSLYDRFAGTKVIRKH